MAQGTTFNLPNYVAPLFELSKLNTKFLAAIGGLNNNAFRLIRDVNFGISTYDLNVDDTGSIDDSNAANQEGQNAPTGTAFPRSGRQNVVEIFHRTVDVSYTKQATADANAVYAGVTTGGNDYPQSLGQGNGITELDWQIERHIKKLARIINNQFINGSYAFPDDNAAPRRTRGILDAITTNVIDADVYDSGTDDDAPEPLTAAMVQSLIKDIFDSGGLEDENGAVIMVNSTQKLALDGLYKSVPDSRTVGGSNIEQIVTPLGTFGVMTERAMPQDELAIVSLDVVKPAALPIPGKGILFEEPLGKTGAADQTQIYGELGLDHGPEEFHGKITGLKG